MLLPVIRGKMGNWRYYSGIMSFEQVAKHVTASIGELYQAQCLDELLQRELTNNYSAIKEYLLNDDERFFNALILAIYDGDPQWLEIEFENNGNSNVGFLKFSGKEVIFPVDGQHRVAGIKAAIEEKEQLKNETVPVIFIAHSQTPEGRTRTRKLFSTLNRRAKPVGQNENIALDEDDVCSIITRDLLQNYPLFQNDSVVNSKSKQIPNNNFTALTSLIALYQAVCVIVKRKLGLSSQGFKNFQLYRPTDELIKTLSDEVHAVFDAFAENTESVKIYQESTEEEKAKFYRNKSGGDIVFRPIVFTDYIDIALTLVKAKNITISDSFSALNKVPHNLNSKPWTGLLWDGAKIVNRTSHTMIKNMLILMTNSTFLSDNDYIRFVDSYAKALTIDAHEAESIIKEFVDICEKR